MARRSSSEGTGQRPDIRVIAQLAGVSQTTVSNVLLGKGRVSEETRRRVVKIVDRLGYVPNAVAQELVTRRTTNIGILFPRHFSDELNTASERPNYYVSAISLGAELAAQELGYNTFIASCDADCSPQELPRIVRSGGIAGLLLCGGAFTPGFVERLAGITPCLVAVGASYEEWGVNSVAADNAEGTRKAVQHLIRLGRRKIALLNGPISNRTAPQKLAGYKAVLEAAGLTFAPDLVNNGEYEVESGCRLAHEIIAGHPDVDGFVTADDHMAIGAINALRDAGKAVPGDVSVVGFGDSPLGEVTYPSLTTVRVHQRKMGQIGVQRLIEMVGQRDQEPLRISVSATLVVRGSCGSPGLGRSGE